MSDNIKSLLPRLTLMHSWEERRVRNRRIDSVTCDICQGKFTEEKTKVDIAVALLRIQSSDHDIALASASFPWTRSYDELVSGLVRGGYERVRARSLATLLMPASSGGASGTGGEKKDGR
jgi:hypothetical protein